SLMRDYDALRVHYTQLEEKRLSAEMASQLESQEAGERFVVLDPAVAPEKPFGPNRRLIIGFGMIVGLCAGIGAGVLVEISDGSVRHDGEAAKIVGKPVLAGIPKIISSRERRWYVWRAATMVMATTVAAVFIGLAVSRFTG